jgi:hypothetical protein
MEWEEFFRYNDLGLPLAYGSGEEILSLSDFGIHLVNETFDLLLEVLGLEDTGWETIEDILNSATVDSDTLRNNLGELPDDH